MDFVGKLGHECLHGRGRSKEAVPTDTSDVIIIDSCMCIHVRMCFILIEGKVLTVIFTILCAPNRFRYYFHSFVFQRNVLFILLYAIFLHTSISVHIINPRRACARGLQ